MGSLLVVSLLEGVVDADGDDLVLTCVDLCGLGVHPWEGRRDVGVDRLRVLPIVGEHVGDVQLDLLGEVYTDAETIGVGAHVEVDIALIGIRHPLACEL